MISMMIDKGNKFLVPKGHVNEMEVSRLESLASHMGFLTFRVSGFLIYVLQHEMENSMLVSQGF